VTKRRFAAGLKFAQCVGLAAILLVVNYGDLLGGGADVRMHVPYRLTGVCAAHILDILILGTLLFLILAVAKRTRYYSWVRLLFLMLMPLWIALRVESLLPFDVNEGVGPLVAAVWAAVLLLLLLKFPLGYRRLVRLAEAAGMFLAVFGVCTILQLLWVMRWRPGAQEITAAWSGKTAAETRQRDQRVHPRVVWILFDELSYDQVFEHRAHDLALPNFDALRAQSTVYTDMQPIGMKTVKVIPSLLSGSVIDDYRFRFNNTLAVHDQNTKQWKRLDGAGTIFGDAKRAGWRTGVVGWYNPYCTLYGPVLDSCYWTNFDRMDGNMAQRRSWRSNTARPLRDLAVEVQSPSLDYKQECDFDVEQRYQTHRELEAKASTLIAEDQADFVYLHFSTPHSPNIWSRISDNYVHKCGSSYLDNLALADRELGKIMALVRSSPRWKDTTVVVQGDHSWRVMLWDGLASWTDEDEQASHDETFDPRPALIIHQAGQTTGQTDGRAMPLLVVHGALENVLAGKPAAP
jgi:hypothetical protein